MQEITSHQEMAKDINVQTITQRIMRYGMNTLLIILFAVSLAACGSNKDPEPPTPPTSIPVEVSEEAVEEVVSTEEETAEEEEAPAADEAMEGTTDEEAAEEEAVAEEEAPVTDDAVDESTDEETAPAEEEAAAEEEIPVADEAAEESTDEEDAPAAEEAPATDEAVEGSTDEGAAPAEEEAATGEESSAADEAVEESTDEEVAPAEEEVADPRVFFIQPTDYAILPITSTIVMGVEGLDVEPAGEIREGAGHLHILVDADFIAPGDVIPSDELHLHYGKGQLSAEVGLTPGEHTLRLQFANGAHIAMEGDQYRAEINVTVTEDAAEKGVYFVTPSEGDTVSNPIEVIMAASGLEIEPAGNIRENAGHLHILVNTEFIVPGEVIVNDETHLHYGKAQTETTLELEPGEYVLRLQLANGAHIALEGEEYQDEINIIVE